MKRLLNVVMLTLAVNFLAAAGGIGWLYKSGHLDRERVVKIRELVFPPPAPPAPAATQPSSIDPLAQPTLRLDALLARQTNVTAGQQVEFIRQTFDTQMAQLERRARELQDLKSQVDLASGKLATDRAALEADRNALTQQQETARKLAADQGFQDSLNLYTTMQPKQVKAIFLAMNDDMVMQYLQAMQPRTAAKIIKEFKAPEEIERIHRVLDRMRQAQPAAPDGKEPNATTAPG